MSDTPRTDRVIAIPRDDGSEGLKRDLIACCRTLERELAGWKSLTDLHDEQVEQLDKLLAEERQEHQATLALAAKGREALEASESYARASIEALRLAKAWIERDTGNGESLESQIEQEDKYLAKYPGKTFWTPEYSAMTRAVIAALAKADLVVGPNTTKSAENAVNTAPDFRALELALHPIWTACVGLPGYDKRPWQDVQNQLLAAMRDSPVT